MTILRGIVFLILFTFFFKGGLCQGILTYVDTQGHVAPVTTLFDWQIKRGQILDSMQALFGRLPDDPSLPPFNTRVPDLPDFNTIVIDSMKTNSYSRYNIRFTVAENEEVTAYLYIPLIKGKGVKFPAMLALHQTEDIGKGSVDGQGPYINMVYAKELAERGYVVIAPDYPGFGGQKNYDFAKDRYESGVMKAIFNHIRCVDFLQARVEVDPERIGVIGHSLGGHSSMFVGAFDTRLKVVVSSCGWTLFDYDNLREAEHYKKIYGGRLGDWATDRYMPLLREKYNLDSGSIPFDFDEVIAAIAPRAFFSNSPLKDADFDANGVRIGVANALAVYRFLDAEQDLQVRYPDSVHDFSPEIRVEAYNFLDKYLK